MLRKLLCSWQV